jgi:hypothetical protein
MITHKQAERFFSDPRERLLSGAVRSFPEAMQAVARGLDLEIAECIASHQRDGAMPAVEDLAPLRISKARAERAREMYLEARALMEQRLVRRLHEADLHEHAAALVDGDYRKWGW